MTDEHSGVLEKLMGIWSRVKPEFTVDGGNVLETLHESDPEPVPVIWVKTPKCAGTSIIQAFTKLNLPIKVIKWGLVSEFVMNESEHLFQNAHKFAIVRNPFDRLVSSYHYCMRSGWLDKSSSFKDFAKMPWQEIESGPYPMGPVIMVNEVYQHTRPLSAHLSHDFGRCDYIDEFIHFESLESELNNLLERFFMPRIALPKLNKSARQNYQDYYDEETRRCVTEKFKEDLDLFGYSFE